MLMGCAAFAVMYALVHQLRNECDWQIIALIRASLACLFAVLLCKAAGAKLVLLRPPSLWIRSLAGSISLMCGFFAVTREVPVSTVLAISNVFPIWVALLAWPMLGLKPGWPVLVSVVTAVGGVIVMRAPWLEDSGAAVDFGDHTTLAAVCAVASSLFTAVAMLGLHRLHWINTHAVVAHFSGVSALFCLAAVFYFGLQKPLERLLELNTIVLFLCLGLSATIGQVFLTKAFSTGAPAEVAVVNLSTVVMTLMFDVFFFGKSLTWWNLIGMALVMLPTAWVILSPRLRGKTTLDLPSALDSSPPPVDVERQTVENK